MSLKKELPLSACFSHVYKEYATSRLTMVGNHRTKDSVLSHDKNLEKIRLLLIYEKEILLPLLFFS